MDESAVTRLVHEALNLTDFFQDFRRAFKPPKSEQWHIEFEDVVFHVTITEDDTEKSVRGKFVHMFVHQHESDLSRLTHP